MNTIKRNPLTKLTAIILVGSACLAGCAVDETPTIGEASYDIVSNDEQAYIAGLTDAERQGSVAFVNDDGTSEQLLDIDCRLYRDAAKHLIRYRDGRGNQGARQFASLEEIAVYLLTSSTIA
jgi:hypothetical protein